MFRYLFRNPYKVAKISEIIIKISILLYTVAISMTLLEKFEETEGLHYIGLWIFMIWISVQMIVKFEVQFIKRK